MKIRKKLRWFKNFFVWTTERQLADNWDGAVCRRKKNFKGKAIHVEMSTKQLNIQIWSFGHKSLIRMQAGTQQMKFKAIRLESETKEENVV